MRKHLIKFAGAVLLAASASATPAATLIVDGNGILTGATGVDVAGTLYDVAFLVGSCASVFSGCDSTSDFAFNGNSSTAAIAAQSLIDQVFLGIYDTNSALTQGCTSTSECLTFIPASISGSGYYASVFGVYAVNRSGSGSDSVSDPVPTNLTNPNYDFANTTNITWGRFTPSAIISAVPEPSTWAMMLVGFGAMGVALRRRRRADYILKAA